MSEYRPDRIDVGPLTLDDVNEMIADTEQELSLFNDVLGTENLSILKSHLVKLYELKSRMEESKLKPIYTHDCGECIFLGIDKYGDVPVDMYVCSQVDTSPTIIIRFSSERSDYTSWNFIFMDNPRDFASPSFRLAYSYYGAAKQALNFKMKEVSSND